MPETMTIVNIAAVIGSVSMTAHAFWGLCVGHPKFMLRHELSFVETRRRVAYILQKPGP